MTRCLRQLGMRSGGWAARLALPLLFVALAVSTASATEETAGAPPASEVRIAPGQDELFAAMLGRGATLPGSCAFTGGQVAGAAARSTYRCPDGEVVLELRHPGAAPTASVRTARFALVVVSGLPPPDLLGAVESLIRAREASFEWTRWSSPPSPPLPAPPAPRERSTNGIAVLALVALLCAVALAWVARRFDLRRRVQAAVARMQQILRDPWPRAVIAIFVVSAVSRAWLGIVNFQSNDDHYSVAQMIRDGGWLPPASSACMECSHAKLYHYTLAAAVQLTRQFPSVQVFEGNLILGNLLNFAALTVLLVLFLVFSRDDRWSTPVRVIALAFMSFNAGLVGIFSQSTNDGFCVLFSSLAVFSLGRFFADLSMKRMAATTVFMILAALSKASGWAIFGASVGVLALKLVCAPPNQRRKYAAATAVLLVGFLAVVPFVNPYRENIARAGTPFVNDEFDVPVMKIEVPREPSWPLQMFLTFRYLELLRVPYNTYGPGPYPLHRESLWSQLYGRMFFLRFDQNIWQSTDPRVLSLGRLCLVLGLLPFAALLVGTADRLRSVWLGVSTSGWRWFALDGDWHHLVYVGTMIAALVALIVRYHRQAVLFTWMKGFYLFPAILSFLMLFLVGLELLWRRHPRLVAGWMLLLVAASIADLGWLIHDLTSGLVE